MLAAGLLDYEVSDVDCWLIQVCRLSCDRLLLGNVPVMTCTRRVVSVSNLSPMDCLQYTWHVTNECHAQVSLVHNMATR